MSLKTLVEQSNLPPEDKELWFSVLEKSDQEQVKIFEDFINGEEEKLKFMTENIKTKRDTFKMADQELLDSVIDAEL